MVPLLGSSATSEARAARGGWRGVVALLIAALWLSCLWSLPTNPHAPPVFALSVEIAALLVLLALLAPLRHHVLGDVLRYTVAAATTLVVTLKLGELVIRASLGRPLNPLLDMSLAPSLVHLLSGMLGPALSALAFAASAAALGLVFVISVRAVGAIQRVLDRPRIGMATVAIAGLMVASYGLRQLAPQLIGQQPISAHATQMLGAHWTLGRQAVADQVKLAESMASDSFRDLPAEVLLSRLDGIDVLLLYVESYGRSALELPRYAETIQPRLEDFEAQLASHGLHAVSGYLTSPSVGGQSWLAHGTIQSGLWIPHQRHYNALVRSDWLTLTKAFGKAGHRTLAVKPAITMPWPEGEQFGYDQIYAAADLGYAGLPYNWVTMPDQYTLSTLERLERATSEQPLFAEVSLISSHAPWIPIPPVLDDWSSIGDGEIFSRWAEEGDPPRVVWRDPERVRYQYTLAIDYVLGVLASYAASFADDRTLLIIVGDHQPAPIITGEGASRDVPIHVISGNPSLLMPFEALGLHAGMHPTGPPIGRMDILRDWFLETFSEREQKHDDPVAAIAQPTN
ncbi:MAG: sulfatase [Pseudomonadota bacterium]